MLNEDELIAISDRLFEDFLHETRELHTGIAELVDSDVQIRRLMFLSFKAGLDAYGDLREIVNFRGGVSD